MTYEDDAYRCLSRTSVSGGSEYGVVYDDRGRIAALSNEEFRWQLRLETISTADGLLTSEYVWGKDISGSLGGAAGIGGLLYTKINGAIYVPQYDAYGNIIGYCDATGSVVATYTYDAFGRTIAQSGSLADVFAFRYSTKYFDRETGFYYYGKRYYSPALRRWITRDPIGEDGGVNLYGFCGNAAVCRYDTYGQSWSSCFGDCFENWRLDWVSLTAAIVGSSLTTLPKDPQELRGLGPVAERRSETSVISLRCKTQEAF